MIAIPFIYRVGLGAVLVACAWFYVTDLRHDRDRARQEAADAASRERAAHAQSDLTTAASAPVDAAQSRALTITLKAQEAAHAVSVAPGGAEPVASAVLELWGRSIDGMRDEAAAARAAANPGGGEPSGSVPSTR